MLPICPPTKSSCAPVCSLRAYGASMAWRTASASHLVSTRHVLFTLVDSRLSLTVHADSIPPFLARISKIYREQTSYHNFQHALDVLQAVYCYLTEAGCVPSVEILLEQEQDGVTTLLDDGKGKARASLPSDVFLPAPRRRKLWRKRRTGGVSLLNRALRNQDLFALYVAAIGHDIGHPGLSNTFMVKHFYLVTSPHTHAMPEKRQDASRRALRRHVRAGEDALHAAAPGHAQAQDGSSARSPPASLAARDSLFIWHAVSCPDGVRPRRPFRSLPDQGGGSTSPVRDARGTTPPAPRVEKVSFSIPRPVRHHLLRHGHRV